MSEKLTTVACAYTKGVNAQRKHKRELSRVKVECPYGAMKRELAMWWHAGYNDSLAGNIEQTLYRKGD